ncbi:MAG: hypothetical protein LBE91_11240 [Tannerella sp.]|nr:hypothetical protein [Tannerella sp.]
MKFVNYQNKGCFEKHLSSKQPYQINSNNGDQHQSYHTGNIHSTYYSCISSRKGPTLSYHYKLYLFEYQVDREP